MSVLPVLVLYAIWSSIFAIGKWTLEYSPPLLLTAVRMGLAGVGMTLFLLAQKRKWFQLSLRQFFSICLLALFSIYLTNALEFWGLQQMTAAKTCFFYSLSPFFAAILSYIHFKEKMNWKKGLGMLIGLIGFAPVLMLQKGSEELLSSLAFLSWPELAVLGAAFFSNYGWVLLRLLVKNHEVSPVLANGLSMLIGAVFALVHSYFVESWAPTFSTGSIAPFLQGTVLMTLVSNVICYNLYGMLLKKFTATFLSFMGLLSPIFASINGWIFLGEPFSPAILLSTGVVSIGAWIFYSAELRQGYIVRSQKNVPQPLN